MKKPVSIYRKLKKNGLEISEENILNGIHDVGGVRVICSFIDDIYTVAGLLANQMTLPFCGSRIISRTPNQRYRSYHMIVEVPVFFSKGKTPMKVEIQIRTIAMDFLGKPGASARL